MAQHRHKEEWYRSDSKSVAHMLKSDMRHGLTNDESALRLKTDGLNQFTEGERRTWIDSIVEELRNPLTFILLCAGMLTTILGEYVDATVIFLALIINIAISLYQEGRADRAFEKLKNAQERYAVVVRDGKKERIDAHTVVVGDLVFVEAGMHIPADMRLVDASNLEVNESPLTGEWLSVGKHSEALDTVLPFVEQKNMAFMGTFVASGVGMGLVVATGSHTRIGIIAASLGETRDPETPLTKSIARVARLLSFIVFAALVLIILLGLFRGEPLAELFLTAIAVAVAAIPEGLPAAVTVVLAIGMEAILSRGGLVRNLLSAETLGSTTVILTDKTGTLTKGEMELARVITLGTILTNPEHSTSHRIHEVHGDERDVLEFAALCSDAFIEHPIGDKAMTTPIVRGRPVERAVVTAALLSGSDQTELLENYPRLDFLPFASERRTALSLHRVRGMKHGRVYMTGAPELLLEHAAACYREGEAQIASDEYKKKILATMKHFMKDGYRLVAVGYRNTHLEQLSPTSAEDILADGIIWCGLLVLHDPLREDVPRSIRSALRAGTRVLMATGDNPETARTIASDAGIWKEGDEVLTGTVLEGMSDSEIRKALKHTTVFARMLPEHKLRLVRILMDDGEVVAMTGDGVNDAPALRAASIGVALGSGTEVAKEASDIILENNSFTIIVSAIEEGRRIIDNLRKIVAYLLSTSFTEIIAVAGALMIGLPIPLLPAQILWTNMLSEGFMNFAFAFEPKEDDLMTRDPRTMGTAHMLSSRFMSFIIVVGLIGGFTLLGYYAFVTAVLGYHTDDARTAVFMMLTIGTIAVAFLLKDLKSSVLSTSFTSNRYLLGSCAFAVTGLVLALHVPFLQKILRISDISPLDILPSVLGFLVVQLALVEGAKYYFFPRRTRVIR
jgi:P-type Ca2+ transporter type 2C